MQDYTAAPRQALNPALIEAAIKWQNGGMKARFGWDVLNASDTPTGEVIPALTGSVVSWAGKVRSEISSGSAGSSATVRRTATLPLAGPTSVNVLTRRFRPWCEIRLSDGTWAKFYRGVFVSTLPPITDDGIVVTRSLDLASKEHRYSLDELRAPIYVPQDTDALLYVKNELQTRYGETVFDFPAGQALMPGGLAFEPGVDRLSFYNTILSSVGFGTLHCNDVGAPRLRYADDTNTKPKEFNYAPGGTQLPGGSVEAASPELPNVIEFHSNQAPSLANEGNGKYTVRNQSTGPASISQRGYEVFKRIGIDTIVDPASGNGQPALVAKGKQIAQMLFSGGGYRTSGRVGLNPLHSDDDVVGYIKPRLELTSNTEWFVTGWSDTFDATSGITDLDLEYRVVLS